MSRLPDLLLTALGLLLLVTSSSGEIAFKRDIRPIFTAHCTACHGGVKAAGSVSFVLREKALGTGKSGEPTIVPGKPEASELMRRVLSDDPDEIMPQPDHGPRLSDADIGTLRQWIAEGARWSEHWSLVPPEEPQPPSLVDPAWPALPLDTFVLGRLEEEKLPPSAPASMAEWLRRVSLDLTGLPPTLADYDAFTASAAADHVRLCAMPFAPLRPVSPPGVLPGHGLLR